MKKILCVMLALLSLVVFAGCGGSKTKSAQETQDEKSIKVIQTAMGCTEEIAKKSYDIMKSVELTPIKEMKAFTPKKDSWKLTVGKLFVSALGTKDTGFTHVQAEGKMLDEKGKVLMKASDFLVTQTEADKCKRRAERVVKERLKDPDSVKFDEKNWGTKKENGMFVAQGVYRAKNSFGGYVVEFYTVTLDKNFNVKTVKSEPYR